MAKNRRTARRMKTRIYLGGLSCKLEQPAVIMRTLAYVLDNLSMPYEVMEDVHGWEKLQALVNEPGYLWIVNDTAWGHLIDANPYIIIVRDAVWTWPSARGNCVGRFTQTMLTSQHGAIHLARQIMTMKPIRQHGSGATKVHHVVNEYTPTTTDAIGRNGMAAATWRELGITEPSYVLSMQVSQEPVLVNEMLKDGLELLKSDDDLLVITNRDICLTPEFIAIVRAYMDNIDVDMCYTDRAELDTAKVQAMTFSAKDLQNAPVYRGTDTFVFRRGANVEKLLRVPLWMGGGCWDWYWNKIVANRCPWIVTYHYTHQVSWHTSKKTKENMEQILLEIPHARLNQLALWA